MNVEYLKVGFKIVEDVVHPLWIKFKLLNPIVRWSVYIFGVFGLNGLYNFLLRKINNYPPGRYGLPIFGNLFILYTSLKSKYSIADAKYYKTVSMTYFGKMPQVIIHDINIAKQMFVQNTETRKALLHKYSPFAYDSLETSNGYEWKYRRQLTHKSLSMLLDSKYIDTRIHTLISNNLYPILDEYCNTNKKYYFRKDLKYAMYQFSFVASFGNNVDIPKRDGNEYKSYAQLTDLFWGVFTMRILLGLFIGPGNFIGRYLDKRITKGNDVEGQLFKMFEKYVETYKNNIKNNKTNQDCYLARQLEQQKSISQFNDKKLITDLYGINIAAFHITLGIYICVRKT